MALLGVVHNTFWDYSPCRDLFPLFRLFSFFPAFLICASAFVIKSCLRHLFLSSACHLVNRQAKLVTLCSALSLPAPRTLLTSGAAAAADPKQSRRQEVLLPRPTHVPWWHLSGSEMVVVTGGTSEDTQLWPPRAMMSQWGVGL